MKTTCTYIMATLLIAIVNANGPSSNTRHFGGGHFGRPVNRPGHLGGGQFGHAGGHLNGHIPSHIGGGQFGAVGAFGGVPQGVRPPLIGAPQRPDCKFFKRGPYGNYICDVDQKPFECPLVRPYCPRFGVPVGPQKCYNDNDCYGFDKCCRDACFDYLICKGPE